MYLYTILIQWSDEDNCFVVFLPEFTDVMHKLERSMDFRRRILVN